MTSAPIGSREPPTRPLESSASYRETLGASIPLACSADGISGPAAIEVYPAATLIAHSLPRIGYKKPEQVESRRSLVESLRQVIALPADLGVCDASADALDAVVCVVAAAHFANGRCMSPEDCDLAEREGWIWVASRRATNGSQ